MNIRPLMNRVVIKPHETEQVSAGGIVLTGAAQELPTQGTVVAVGPGTMQDSGELLPVDISVGDVVLYGKYAGDTIATDDGDLVIVLDSDISAVLVGS